MEGKTINEILDELQVALDTRGKAISELREVIKSYSIITEGDRPWNS